MHRRAEFFRIDYPLKLEDIKNKFKNVKDRQRKVQDKNHITKKITLGCSFDNKKERDGNYLLGVHVEYQIHPKKGMSYQKTSDLFGFIFFLSHNLLVVLGRDEAIGDAVKEVSKILYPDEDLRVLSPITFTVDSLVKTITEMRKDDPESWCDEYRARHDGVKYQDRKTKSNFSLGPGQCVLDDLEAQGAIDASTSISPKYKFYICPKLNPISYDRPKTISFNGRDGVISISIEQKPENWYRFISDFLLKTLMLNS